MTGGDPLWVDNLVHQIPSFHYTHESLESVYHFLNYIEKIVTDRYIKVAQ